MTRPLLAPILVGLLVFGTPAGRVLAGGWKQFRGDNHDGTSLEKIRLNWAEAPPKTLWKVSLPNGLSSFSVSSGRLFTMGARQSDAGYREYCIALDANTGAELWSTEIGLASYPNGGVGTDDGTRGTPSVDGDRVFVFGGYLNLLCLDASTGAVIWQHDLQSEFGSVVIPWQNAASPLLVGDLILVNGNGRSGEHLLAFRKADGSVAWKSTSDPMTQSSPIAATIGGVSQAVFFTQTGLVAVAPATGAVLWRYALPYNGTSVAASPVVAGDTVYASRAYPTRAGAVVVRVSNNAGVFTATKVWDKPNQLMNHWATPIFHNGFYYGVYGQGSLNLRAVDAANGDTKWTVTGFGYGSVTRVGDKLLVLGDDGTLALVDTNPDVYTELARIEPLQGRCWNNPAVSDGRIYIRSTTEAVALDVAVDAPPPLSLRLQADVASPSMLTVTVGSVDGLPLDANAASNVSLQFSPALGAAAGWAALTNTPAVLNGQAVFTLPLDGTGAGYYRTVEGP